MKELKQFLYVFMMIVATLLVGCTKEGPQGEPGKDGINGENGTNGENGADGASGCIQCHKNDQEIPMKVDQYKFSAHSKGNEHVGHFISSSCTMCHTSQGFLQATADGTNEGGSHDQVTGMSCYTCHQIHNNYTRDDYAMNYSGEVDFILNGNGPFTDVIVDAGEPSNTCVKCHQPRTQGSNQPDPSKAETETLTISGSSAGRYGPHHGAQGAIYGGVGGYLTVAQGEGSKGKHNCVFCHMGTDAVKKTNGSAGGYESFMAGGHAFNLTFEHDGSLLIDRCNECHAGNDGPDDIPAIIAANDLLIDGLKDKLIELGIATDAGSLVAGTYTHQQLAAFWNYKLLEEDLSHGLHNPGYTLKLVTSSLEYLGAN